MLAAATASYSTRKLLLFLTLGRYVPEEVKKIKIITIINIVIIKSTHRAVTSTPSPAGRI